MALNFSLIKIVNFDPLVVVKVKFMDQTRTEKEVELNRVEDIRSLLRQQGQY